MTWTEGVITRQPAVDKVSIRSRGLASVARRQAREYADWTPAPATGETAEPAEDLIRRFGQSLRTQLLPQRGQIARQVALKHLSLARVAVALHPHRVYYVYPTTSEPHVLVLPSQRRVLQSAAALIAVVAVLVVVSRLIG
ncbi:hypothetical protein [Streptomyces sp. NPDC051098]|uniref:hypothetical protein n=1 Tax=Streptomyces sp. NPDC051098 TaxID=3155411 RepID=UPI0034484E51